MTLKILDSRLKGRGYSDIFPAQISYGNKTPEEVLDIIEKASKSKRKYVLHRYILKVKEGTVLDKEIDDVIRWLEYKKPKQVMVRK